MSGHAVGTSSGLPSAQFSRRGFTKLMAGGIGIAALPGVAACGSSRSGPNSGGGGQTLSLTALQSDKPGADVVIGSYKKTASAATVKGTYPNGDAYNQAIRTQLTGGTASDVFEAAPGNGNPVAIELLGPAGYLMDLSAEPWVKDIPPGIKPVTQVGGKTLLLPVTGGVFAVLYNQSVFTKLGIEPPKTWSTFLDVCDKVKKSGMTPIALGNGGGGVGSIFLSYQLAASTNYAVDPGWETKRKNGSVTFVGSGWDEALTKLAELNKRGYFNPSVNGTSGDQASANFAAGKAAMTGIVSQAYGSIQQQAANAKFGSFPLPGVDDAAKVWAAAGSGYGYVINSKAKDVEAAKVFLRTAAKPAQVAAFNKALGGIPLLPATAGAVPAALSPMVPYVKGGKSATYMDQLWPNADVQQALFKGTQQLLGGQASPRDVLAAMDAAYDKK